METLRPVEVNEYYINRVAYGLKKYFWTVLFKPIFDILNNNSVINSKNALLNAIKSGRVYYQDGAFRTIDRFSNAVAAELEKMGAVFRYNAYFIPKSSIPVEYASTLAIAEAQAAAKARAINTFLLNYLSNLGNVSVEEFIQVAAEQMYKKLELDIIKSFQEKKIPIIELGLTTPKVKLPKAQTKNIERYWDEKDQQAAKLNKEWKLASDKVAHMEEKGQTDTEEYEKAVEDRNNKSIVLRDFQADKYANAPVLDIEINDIELDKRSKKIAEDYTYNMKYWVQKWEAKNIVIMRKEVLDMIQAGKRTPEIQRYFMSRWNIAQNKAHFLAVNESHLAASVLKATQYQEGGCTKFKWTPSVSKEKRKLHEEYYNKYFDFDNPPILDDRLGIKGLPRQIWNCRCGMAPVVPSWQQLLKVENAKRNIIEKIKYTIANSKQRNNNAWRYRRFGEGQTL